MAQEYLDGGAQPPGLRDLRWQRYATLPTRTMTATPGRLPRTGHVQSTTSRG